MDVLIDAIIEMHLRNLRNVALMPPFFNYSKVQNPLIRRKIQSMMMIEKTTLDSVLDFITQEVFKTIGVKVINNNSEGK